MDLNNAEQAKRLLSVVGQERLSPSVSGLSIASKSVQAAVSPAVGFQNVSFGGAVTRIPSGKMKGYDRLVMFYDDIRLVVLAHEEANVVTVGLERIGFRRHRLKT